MWLLCNVLHPTLLTATRTLTDWYFHVNMANILDHVRTNFALLLHYDCTYLNQPTPFYICWNYLQGLLDKHTTVIFEMKTQTQNVPLLTSTQVYYFISFIYASKFMSLQKKATVCPSCWHRYYKNGGVNQRKLATKQSEASTKSLEYYGETDKKLKEKLLQASKMSNLT